MLSLASLIVVNFDAFIEAYAAIAVTYTSDKSSVPIIPRFRILPKLCLAPSFDKDVHRLASTINVYKHRSSATKFVHSSYSADDGSKCEASFTRHTLPQKAAASPYKSGGRRMPAFRVYHIESNKMPSGPGPARLSMHDVDRGCANAA
jgi:hypothetical protein